MELASALFMELFITIHMSVFVLWPMSRIIYPDNSKAIFITLSILRALTLIIFDFFISTSIAAFDFFMVFLGAFIIVPISSVITTKIRKKKGTYKESDSIFTVKSVKQPNSPKPIAKHCPSCGLTISKKANYCPNCGVRIVKASEIKSNNSNLNSNPIKEK